MSDKRKTEEINAEVQEKKRAKILEVDALTNLPDSLQLRILSSLDSKYAVQTSVLSTTWFSLWKWVPVLEFNSTAFAKLKAFDNFVDKVLCVRDQSAKLDSLTFNRRGACSAKSLNNVLSYACSHGVKKVEAFIQYSRNKTWPITSSESLTSLKLQSDGAVGCPFLGPSSASFKNLSVLYLRQPLISDRDPFSGFPALKKLTLLGCHPDTETAGRTLRIRAPQLTDLTISSYESFDTFQLATPKLKFFEYRGSYFPPLKTHEGLGLPVLEHVVIDFHGLSYPVKEKRMFDDMLSFFTVLRSAKSLMLYPSIVYLLSLFPDELAKQNSPFCNLNSLKLDLEYLRYSCSSDRQGRWSFEICSEVRGYLLKNSPDAKFILVHPVCLN